jgi:hypothetical protein
MPDYSAGPPRPISASGEFNRQTSVAKPE